MTSATKLPQCFPPKGLQEIKASKNLALTPACAKNELNAHVYLWNMLIRARN